MKKARSYKGIFGIRLNKNQILIMQHMKDDKRISRRKLADTLGITVDGVKYNIKKLKDKKLIMRIGPLNGGYWQVNVSKNDLDNL